MSEARQQRVPTRERLTRAALELVGDGRGFGSLGLREVARAAGVVPTAFYRHFRDMEALGLALVDEGGVTLRRLLREVRRDELHADDMIRQSAQTYVDYLHANRLHMLFLAGERLGGPPPVRDAVRREVAHFADDMAQDLLQLELLPHLSVETLRMVSTLVVNTMLDSAAEILDFSDGSRSREADPVTHLVDQLRLIFLGAGVWREGGPR